MLRIALHFFLFVIVPSVFLITACGTVTTDAQKRFDALNIPFTADRFVQFAGQGDLSVVTAFLDAGMQANVADSGRAATPLINASANGHVVIVQKLLTANAEIDETDINGCTALVSAAYFGRVETAALLISKGANANVNPAKCLTPLGAATLSGKSEIVESLLTARADPKLKLFNGASALSMAASAGRVGIVKRLLASGYSREQLLQASDAAKISGHLDLAKLIAEAAGNG
jgi:ankyrin repeat protein